MLMLSVLLYRGTHVNASVVLLRGASDAACQEKRRTERELILANMRLALTWGIFNSVKHLPTFARAPKHTRDT
jgi:hypothetical protein